MRIHFFTCLASIAILFASTCDAATAIAIVPGTKIWGVGIKSDLPNARNEAVAQCLEGRPDKMEDDCQIIAETALSSGGAIVESENGVTFNIAAKSEIEAVKVAYQNCQTQYKNCKSRALISWFETGGMILTSSPTH
jgi:hypothetical protein